MMMTRAHLWLPLALLAGASPGCAVGLDAHPLTDLQSAALRSRPAPRTADEVPKMTSLVVAVPIDASVETVWHRLAVRYGDVHDWSGPIEDSDFAPGHVQGGHGAVRSCKLGPTAPLGKGKSFSETILVWNDETHFFSAGVDDGFYPLRRVVQEYWVDADASGKGSVVTTQFHFDLAPPMGKGKGLVGRLKPQVVTSLLGLKHLIETGDAARSQDQAFLAETYRSVYSANGV